jgi:hypothetical protein
MKINYLDLVSLEIEQELDSVLKKRLTYPHNNQKSTLRESFNILLV